MKPNKNHEVFNEIGPENQALADLLQRARFVPTPSFQANLWKKLQHKQLQQQDERSHQMSFLVWPVLGKMVKLGFTVVVSSALVAVILLGGTLVVSPSARAQVQQLIVRFIEVESPEAFLTEQVAQQQALAEENKVEVMPTEDSAASAKPVEQPKLPSSEVNQGQALPGANQKLPTDVPLPSFSRSNLSQSLNLVSLEEAQSRTNFTIKQPSWLPEGYSLQGVLIPPDLVSNNQLPLPADAPQLPAPDQATLHFSNSAGDVLTLSQIQRPTLPNIPSPPEVLLPISKDKGSVEEVTINGQPGQLIKMNSAYQLHWQSADGMMYDLLSHTVDQATLMHIAESVK